MTTLKIDYEIAQLISNEDGCLTLDVPSYGNPRIMAYLALMDKDNVKSSKYLTVTARNKIEVGRELR